MRARASSNPAIAQSPSGVCRSATIEHQKDRAAEDRTGDDLLDPVETHGSGGGNLKFVLIGEQPRVEKASPVRR